MRSRFLSELTTPEVEDYLAKGGKTAFLPVGCVEMHGPHQPIGTDTHIANAFSLRMAEECNGIVFPELHYSWAGSTDGFAGTVSIDAAMVQDMVEIIAVKSLKMGFKRFVIISVHNPNDRILYLASRRIFEKTHIPVLFIDPYYPINQEVDPLFSGVYEKSKEASLVLAALQILGHGDLYSEKEMCYPDKEPAMPESFIRLSRVGTVGYYMQDTRQHACPSEYVSLKKGLEFIDMQARNFTPVLEELDRYMEDICNQKNKGWR